MSRFVTTIAVQVEAVKRLLPKRAHLEGVALGPDKDAVQVFWDDDDFETGFTFPVEFTPSELEGRLLPKGVRKRAARPAALPAVTVPTSEHGTVAKGRGRRGK